MNKSNPNVATRSPTTNRTPYAPAYGPLCWRGVLLLYVSIAAVTPDSAISKTIQVRAKTVLKASVTQDENNILLTAYLVDDASEPVRSAPITADLSANNHLVGITGQDGKVTWSLDASALSDEHLEANTLRVQLAYGGSEERSKTATQYTHAFQQDDIRLAAAVSPSRLSEGMRPEVLLSARRADKPLANVPIQVSVAQYTAVVRTGSDGRARVRSLPNLEPGAYSVEIRFKGTLSLRGKTVTRPLTVAVQPRFVELGVQKGAVDSQLYITGKIMDAKRRPVSGVLRLTSNHKTVDEYEVLGGAVDGSFDLSAHAQRYGEYDGNGRLEFVPTQSWVSAATFGPFPIKIPAPPRPSILWYALMMMVFVLIALRPVFAGIRQAGFWRTRTRAPSTTLEVSTHSNRSLDGSAGPHNPNLLRLVCVSDLVPSSAVQCRISLTYRDGSTDEKMTNIDGQLALAQTQPLVSIQATAKGFVTQKVSLPLDALPQWTIYMVPHRATIRATFEAAMSKVAPSWRFGRDSVSDLISEAPAASMGGSIDSLGRRFERLYYRGDKSVDSHAAEQFEKMTEEAATRDSQA